jgi:hypothetical protein
MAKKHGQQKADQNLDPRQYADLNRRFFADPIGPSRYLTHRMRDIMLGASGSDLIKQAAADGLAFQTLTMSRPTDDDLWDPKTVSRFVAMDATVLLHHAAESLMRLYFAVCDDQECPWLAVGRLRAGQFNDAVRDFRNDLRNEDTREKVRRVFDGFGTYDELVAYVEETQSGTPPTRELWDDAGKALLRLLVHLCDVLLNDAGVYNAAKHGLAVLPSEAGMRLGDGDLVSASGPSLTYLELRDNADGDKKWNETTAWVRADRTLAIVHLIIDRMDNAWGLARCRYTNAGGFKVKGLSLPLVDGVLTGNVGEKGSAITVEKMHVSLAYLDVPTVFGRPNP